MSELNLVLLGPPGAGKGTQAEKLEEDFHLPYVATGNMLRAAVENGTELGRQAKAHMDRGELVPDELIIGMILRCMEEDQCKDGFLLDGFPRNEHQAAALDSELERLDRRLSAALFIDVPDEEVVRRLSGRRTCQRAGHIYHVENNPPKHEGICDIDGSRLYQREDDKPDTIRRRLAVYHEQTEPVIRYYDDRGLLRRFDGTRAPTEVHDHLRAAIATLKLEDAV